MNEIERAILQNPSENTNNLADILVKSFDLSLKEATVKIRRVRGGLDI